MAIDDRRSTTRPGQDRAQTVQDFAVGASIFLLTVSFVFAFVPSLFTPFASEVPPGAAPQADRLSTAIVTDLSEDNRSNWLVLGSQDDNEMDVLDFFDEDTAGSADDVANADDLKDRYSLPFVVNVNVVVLPVNESDGTDPVMVSPPGGGSDIELSIGPEFRDRPAASITRLVVIPEVDKCAPRKGNACRMIVRVW